MLNTFLYHIEAGSANYRFIHIDRALEYEDESYEPVQITHTLPTFSHDATEAEIDITVKDSIDLHEVLLTPPPYPIIINVYEWLGGEVSHCYRGWVVRSRFKLTEPVIEMHLKTVWHFFERESLSDSLSSLSRYSIYDPRANVDIESLKETVTVTEFNDERDILTVTGVTQPDGYYTAGFISAPNLDKRTILNDITEGSPAKRHLYLNGGFSRNTLDIGFPADIYPGDDLLYSTWANKFADQTNHGESWGGWEFMPNVDPALRGVS